MPTNPAVHLAVDLGASGGRVIAGCFANDRLSLEATHRFPNEPVRVRHSLQWDTLALWREIQRGLSKSVSEGHRVLSVGVDTWGVDYVLIDGNENVAGPVHHYRDSRTRGIMERAFGIVPRDEIFAATGVQFMEINTLYQMLAAVLSSDPPIQIAKSFLMMGDYFHWLLTGERSLEVTNASTTQMFDPRTKRWATGMLERFGIPNYLFGEPTEPGTMLGTVHPSVAALTGLGEVPVVVPATHDTASAVLAVPAENFAPRRPDWCYISSGTWSLMGCELPEPRIDAECSRLNFTNEGGVQGSTRLLKNIGGLWIFQQIRESLVRRGTAVSWDEMVESAARAASFKLLLDPDAACFVAPDDMIDAIAGYADRTGQRMPSDNGMLYRAALEALALRYRVCLGMLESLAGNRIETIHIVGGGSLNQLLCQMTADACNRSVIAGPVEATATGNVLMQMIGTGQLHSVDEARRLVRSSFDLVRYEPQHPDRWSQPAAQFEGLREVPGG